MSKLSLISISFLLTVVINYLAVNLPLNGITTQAISDMYLNYFTPAGYVFSIWGLIYLANILVLIVLWKEKTTLKDYIEKSAKYYIAVNLLNALWLVLWHYQLLPLSVIVMVGLLLTLIKLYFLGKDNSVNSKIVRFSNSLYLGWISVATVANISALLTSMSFSLNSVSNIAIAQVMYVVALLLGVLMVKFERDWVYFGVIVWAIVGIINRFSNINSIFVNGITFLVIALVTVLYIKFKDRR